MAVIANRAYGSGAVGAVADVVKRMAASVSSVITVDIINHTVAVVIYAVAWNFALVDPEIGGQIGMSLVDPSVQNSYDRSLP